MKIFKGLLSLLPFLAALAFSTASANASVAASPGFSISSFASPSTFKVGDPCEGLDSVDNTACDAYEVTARNTGKLATTGEVTLSDTVPAGLEIQQIRLFWSGSEAGVNVAEFFCGGTPPSVSCGFPLPLVPDATLRLVIFVKAASGAKSEVTNKAKIEGGGAPTVETTKPLSQPNLLNGPPPPFGFSSVGFEVLGSNGALDTQAGDHPYELDPTLYLNTVDKIGPKGSFEAADVEEPRDIVVDLPVGFVGSVNAAPQCTFAQLSSHIDGKTGEGGCPKDTIVGHIRTEPQSFTAIDGPLYNMTPERGEPAEFAYVDNLAGTHVLYTRVVPTPKGYVLQTVSPEIPEIPLRAISLQFYGVPAERDGTGNQAIPLFTDPSVCSGEAPTATIYMDSWENPAKFNSEGMPVNLEESQWAKAESKAPPVTGCNSLQFPATVQAQPTSHESDKPTGLNFSIKLPQSEVFGVPATPTLKKIVTQLPEGLTVDPSAGNGLQACSIAQIGWLGPDGPNSEPLPSNGRLNFNEAAPECPDGSKIGSLELETPLLPAGSKVGGEMFLASQNENPFNSTLAAYVVVHDPVTGILIKIAGEFLPDPHTGQLTAIFDENPNLPFSNLELHFFGGPRAELATPEHCGTFTTATQLFPYSFEEGLEESPTEAFDNFSVDEACPGGFSPTFTAGSENLQAGAFTPFVASFGRSDTDQELAGLSLTLPEGLLGKIAGVPLCAEAQIHEAEESKPGCPESTQVGTTQAGAGPGPNPLFVGGKVYLTGPYNGGPYGLAVVVPAVAGPYDFGTVVVRQSLRIDPRTSQVTDVSDPFPKIIDGIPLRLRRIDVTLNRPEFTFNATSCEKEQFTGAIAGSPLGAPTTLDPHQVGYAAEPGASSPFTAPFQVTNCANLKFEPTLAVTTAGKASKTDGASLFFKISYPPVPGRGKGAIGSQANFNEAKFDLPRQLPARLTTIQKACLAAVFEANPAACPAASLIGHAVVHTQVLPVPLQGPVYFVSYGGAKFPEAVLVLQGDGVTVDLHGETFIAGKTGITSATFRNTPDVPFESIEVTIPSGPFSEFGTNLPAAAKGSLCGQNLKMPTLFKAQNGLEIHQDTAIAVTGCAKAPATRAQKLAAALKACKHKPKGKRASCRAQAHKKYGPVKKKK
jgi:hypothetical protein